MDGFFIEDDRQTTLCGTVTKRSLSIKKLLIGTIFLFKIRKNASMCDRTVVQPEYPAESIQGRPMTEPKPEREALEAMLLGELKHHIDLLQSTEPSFGHATALSRGFSLAEKNPNGCRLGQVTPALATRPHMPLYGMTFFTRKVTRSNLNHRFRFSMLGLSTPPAKLSIPLGTVSRIASISGSPSSDPSSTRRWPETKTSRVS